MPEIPLSVGSKLELHVLLRAFVFAKFPFTSVCPRMCMYIAVYNVHDRDAEGFAL